MISQQKISELQISAIGAVNNLVDEANDARCRCLILDGEIRKLKQELEGLKAFSQYVTSLYFKK